MKAKLILLGILLIIALFYQPLIINTKILLFISEQFPIPIKPLGLVTNEPKHQKIQLESGNGKVVGDLFLPKGERKSAVILAMGVRTQEKDKPILISFANTLTRLGYVVLWPRLERLDKQEALPEEPETFIKSFEYLENLKEVNDKRISFVGFSVGSSTAFIAASNPEIAKDIRALVFFGGYHNIYDYLNSLETKTSSLNGEKVTWQPNEGTNHIDEILKNLGINSISQALSSERLKRYNPEKNIEQFRTRIFILHDKNDSYVHYFESEKLNKALQGKVEKEFLVVDLFEHVQPKKLLTFETLGELRKLYGFLYKVLEYL